MIRQNVYVRVISLKPLREFWERHDDAEEPLRFWYKTATNATWSSLQDVRRTCPQADGVKTSGGDTLTVFNIGGNKVRQAPSEGLATDPANAFRRLGNAATSDSLYWPTEGGIFWPA